MVLATNRDLLHAVETGSFRRDLFYRLNVLPIVRPRHAAGPYGASRGLFLSGGGDSGVTAHSSVRFGALGPAGLSSRGDDNTLWVRKEHRPIPWNSTNTVILAPT